MRAAIPVYIGYDRREEEAWDVCKHSLLRHTSIPVHPIKLKDTTLREIGIYGRDWQERDGIRYDTLDRKPFSTDFAFTRFLSPILALYQGWSLFMDCDMLWRADIAELMALADPKYAVMCVKHDYTPKEGVKMDGQRQETYRRKNWSSFMLFNCEHPANRFLTPRAVSTEPGAWLHGMGWLKDEDIGGLPEAWNWLCGWSSPDIDPKVVHYTLGGPWFDDYRNVPFAGEWLQERVRMP